MEKPREAREATDNRELHKTRESHAESEASRELDRPRPAEGPHKHDGNAEVLPPDELTRRYGIGAEATAARQFNDAKDAPPVPIEELIRRFGKAAEVDRLAEARGLEEARLDAAAAEIARIPELRPEEWKHADQWHRKAALQEVNRIMGRSLHVPTLPLEFKPLPESRDSIVLGETTPDGAYTFIHDKFLGTNDQNFSKYDHPSWAVHTVCHEYRHYYQEEQVWTLHSPVRRELPDEILLQWESAGKNYVSYTKNYEDYRKQVLEQDSNDIAGRTCRKVYGSDLPSE